MKSTNIPPSGVVETHPLSDRSDVYIATPTDGQASIDYLYGYFGFPPGQRSLSVSIQPLRHYHAPHRPGLALDGNVYDFRYRFVPSGKTPTRIPGKLLMGIAAPHTPVDVMGLVKGRWRILCNPTQYLLTISAVNCYTHFAAKEVALLYKPIHLGGIRKHKHRHKKAAVSVLIIIAIVIVVLWASIILFLITRRRTPVETAARK